MLETSTFFITSAWAALDRNIAALMNKPIQPKWQFWSCQKAVNASSQLIGLTKPSIEGSACNLHG